MALELRVDKFPHLGVGGGHDLGKCLDDSHAQIAVPERVRHLQADISGADDHRSPRSRVVEPRLDRQGMLHRV